jgi:hypothetical protein
MGKSGSDFLSETKEQRAFADRHESTRCVMLKATAGERNVAPMNWHW